MVSGTRSASDWSAETGTSARFSRGTATACLTCTMPTTSSMFSSMTGNRENPVRRARSMTSSAVSVREMLATRGRGVMTSCAVWSAKASVRARSVAVSLSRLPSLAERRTSEVSSSAVRAPESSSLGSMPTSRRIAFAVLFSSVTAGRKIAVNTTWKGMTTLPIARGRDSARFFGTSSPMIIESRVATTIAMTVATAETTTLGRNPAKNGSSSALKAGSSV